MRHIKYYRGFESTSLKDDILLYVRDILSDISDDGFGIEFSIKSMMPTKYVSSRLMPSRVKDFSVRISAPISPKLKFSNDFKFGDVSGCINHLISFMADNGYKQGGIYSDWTGVCPSEKSHAYKVFTADRGDKLIYLNIDSLNSDSIISNYIEIYFYNKVL